MAKFRKKPVVIEAVQLPLNDSEGINHENSVWDVIKFMGDSQHFDNADNGGLIIHTLEGKMTADPGDWIIRGIKGELYPCKPDIFETTYDKVEEE